MCISSDGTDSYMADASLLSDPSAFWYIADHFNTVSTSADLKEYDTQFKASCPPALPSTNKIQLTNDGSSSYLAPNSPVLAVDGDLNTFWKSIPGGNGTSEPPVLLEVILNNSSRMTAMPVGTVVIYWGPEYATNYELRCWNKSVNSGGQPIVIFNTSSGQGGVEIIPVSGTCMFIDVSMPAVSSQGYSIKEIEVYGP